MEKYENISKRILCKKVSYEKSIGAFEINLLLYNYEFHFLTENLFRLFDIYFSCITNLCFFSRFFFFFK